MSKKASNDRVRCSAACSAENKRVLELYRCRFPHQPSLKANDKHVLKLSSLRYRLDPAPSPAQASNLQQVREHLSSKKPELPRAPQVICPHCKRKCQGEKGLIDHQKSNSKCMGIRLASHVNKKTTPCPYCGMPIYVSVDGMDLDVHLAGCYERIQEDRQRAIRDENLRRIQDLIKRLRSGVSWDDAFTRWMTIVESDPAQFVRISNMVCALEEQGYCNSMTSPPPKTPPKTIRKVKNMKFRPNSGETTKEAT